MSNLNMFSRLSRGYGTWDGIAKRDTAPEPDMDFFTIDDIHLPPIDEPTYMKPTEHAILYGHMYENKPLKLPGVEHSSPRQMPKTYTTRKGALLLYAEDYFLPGSPKPKKRRTIKKQSASRLKTLVDLRDFVLNYKRNGGDPLFLALLQKRLSGYRDNSVRPGFSPKRYIATLGRSLQVESWNKLASSGSFKDPALQTFNPFLPPVHSDGSACELFPDKPQPYSTMSLPPISPSSSMLGGSFNFYPNGMSTGAASLISVNSEEYAPSSRAMSPAESLNERLSEVESVKPKKDYRYALLSPRQKEELLSHMLVQRTLESVDSDFQGWPTSLGMEDTFASEHDSAPSFHSNTSRRKSKGSLKSASLSSIPRLPPIQSAEERPTTPDEYQSDLQANAESPLPIHNSQSESRILGKSLSSAHDSIQASVYKGSFSRDVVPGAVDASSVQLDVSEGSSHWGDALAQETDFSSEDYSNEEDAIVAALVRSLQGSEVRDDEDNRQQSSTKESTEIPDNIERDSDDSVDVTEQDLLTDEKATEIIERNQDSQSTISVQNLGEVVDQQGRMADDVELDLNEVPGMNQDEATEPASNLGDVAGTTHSTSTSSLSILEDRGPSPEPPPPITFEQLQGEARVVASRILNRPQSGAVFIEDARAALVMWADRLSSLLGPPSKDARTSSAAPQRNFPPILNAVAAAGGGGGGALTRKRTVSRSAGLSLDALRRALLISGGELPGIEALKNLPPIVTGYSKPASKHGSGLSHGHTYYEPLKDGETRSNRDSGSPGPTRSILTERLSNSDLQMEIFNYVTNDDQGFEEDQARVIQDVDSGDEEEFRAALQAVVTDLAHNTVQDVKKEEKPLRIPSKPMSPITSNTEKAKSPPFQVTRPKEEKAPTALQPKQPTTKGKGKLVKKQASKKDTKKGAKRVIKAPAKASKGKKAEELEDPAEIKKVTESAEEEGKDVKQVVEKSPEPSIRVEKVTETAEEEGKVVEQVVEKSPEPSIRVDSETGEHQHSVSTTPTSDMESPTTQSMYSEVSTSKDTSSPTLSTTASIIEQPKLVPKIPEPQRDTSAKNEARALEEKALREEEMVKQKQKETRAAKRAEERAAAAERRRQEVERKRREREEGKRRQIEEEARLEQVRQEAEEEMKRREEDRRHRRESLEKERKHREEEELNQERQAKAKLEREKRMREEFERKKQEMMAQRKLEEEIRREQEKIEAELDEARRREEEEALKDMEESERIALQEKMKREEEKLRRRLEEQRRREEEERRVLEEQRRIHREAMALLRQKKIQRQLFLAGIIREMQFLGLGQRLTRAFTFSYYDILPWVYLNHGRLPSPMKNMINELKKTLPPTIQEEDEEEI